MRPAGQNMLLDSRIWLVHLSLEIHHFRKEIWEFFIQKQWICIAISNPVLQLHHIIKMGDLFSSCSNMWVYSYMLMEYVGERFYFGLSLLSFWATYLHHVVICESTHTCSWNMSVKGFILVYHCYHSEGLVICM